MDMTPLIPSGKQVITAYRPGGFKVSGAEYQGSVIVFPDRVLPWPVSALEDLSVESLQPIIAEGAGIDVLLIGCGSRMAPLVRLKKALRETGVGADPMDTGAACRTFNVLLAEERRVAAALIAL